MCFVAPAGPPSRACKAHWCNSALTKAICAPAMKFQSIHSSRVNGRSPNKKPIFKSIAGTTFMCSDPAQTTPSSSCVSRGRSAAGWLNLKFSTRHHTKAWSCRQSLTRRFSRPSSMPRANLSWFPALRELKGRPVPVLWPWAPSETSDYTCGHAMYLQSVMVISMARSCAHFGWSSEPTKSLRRMWKFARWSQRTRRTTAWRSLWCTTSLPWMHPLSSSCLEPEALVPVGAVPQPKRQRTKAPAPWAMSRQLEVFEVKNSWDLTAFLFLPSASNIENTMTSCCPAKCVFFSGERMWPCLEM